MAKVVTNKPKVQKKPEGKTAPKKNNAELQRLVDTLNKKFGANAVHIGIPSDLSESAEKVERISTGSVCLDIALGGGLPLGRFTEISGAYSSTKTTQCLHIIRNAQERGLVCALVDVEGTTDIAFLKALGVDSEALLYIRPESMEEALQALVEFQRSGEVQLAVLDSIAACMASTKEMGSEMDETVRMGIPQQLLGEYFRKYQMLNNRLTREGKLPFTVIGINQLREKIGVYGDPEYTPGGRAKSYAASVDIRFRRGDWIVEGSGNNKEIVGQVVKFKIEKNKTFKRMTTGEFDFYFGENSADIPVFYNDNYKEVIMAAVEWGIVERAGAWFKYEGEKYQGADALVEALKSNESLVEDMKTKVMYLSTRKGD